MKKLKNSGIQKKLTFMFLFFIVIPLILFFVFGLGAIKKDDGAEYAKNTEKKLAGMAMTMNTKINEAVLRCQNISLNTFVTDGLQKDYTKDLSGVMEYFKTLDKVFDSYVVYERGGVHTAQIYPINQTIPQGSFITRLETLKNKEVWKKLENMENSEVVWDYSTVEEKEYISVYRKINHYEKLLGYFEQRIYLDVFVYMFKNTNLIDGEYLSYVAPDGTILYQNLERPKKFYDITITEKLLDGSVIKASVSKSSVFKDYNKIVFYYTLIFAVLTVVLFFVYKAVISLITRDLTEFIRVLQTNDELLLGGEMISVEGDSEMVVIKQRFKELLQKLQKVYGDMLDMQNRKKAMELELLQSGINPHLLYNSLSVIKWKMLRLKQFETAEMIDNMTEYYRSVLANGRPVITIGEEMRLVEQYIKINEFSYENKFEVVKEIDEELLKKPTIKLILQPIVENSILHGLLEKENGKILIKIEQKDNDIIFTVRDNGYGISGENIEKALDLSIAPKRKGGYGIKNTIKRIKTYYGDEYGIEIRSCLGKGTEVILKIAAVDEEELKKRVETL